MTTSAQLNIDNLRQQVIADLSLSDQQVEQLRLLEANHHLIPASIYCQDGSETRHMDHGVFSTEIKQTVFWANIHAVGAITSPQDYDHYSLEVDDGSTLIFFAPDIVVGQQLTCKCLNSSLKFAFTHIG
jgi:hypothetical protein